MPALIGSTPVRSCHITLIFNCPGFQKCSPYTFFRLTGQFAEYMIRSDISLFLLQTGKRSHNICKGIFWLSWNWKSVSIYQQRNAYPLLPCWTDVFIIMADCVIRRNKYPPVIESYYVELYSFRHNPNLPFSDMLFIHLNVSPSGGSLSFFQDFIEKPVLNIFWQYDEICLIEQRGNEPLKYSQNSGFYLPTQCRVGLLIYYIISKGNYL